MVEPGVGNVPAFQRARELGVRHRIRPSHDYYDIVLFETGQNGAGEWFRTAVSAAEELDYDDLLECFGLRFTTTEQPPNEWKLVIGADATPAQQRNLDAWLKS